MRICRWSTVVALIATGCGSPTSENAAPNNDQDPAETVTYHQDVKPVLDAYCTGCHTDDGVGPFALETYEQVSQYAPLIKNAVESRQMPPFLAAPAVRPLKHDTSLSDEQIATISGWVDDGMVEGDPQAAAPALELDVRQLSRVDLSLEMPEAYTPTTVPDEYRCFVIDWPYDSVKYITGMNVRPGNLAVAHHAVPYLIDPDFVDIVDNADGADGKPGYSCFGGATPPGADSFPTKIIAGWAPGELGQDFPAGSGVRVEPGSRIILQMHYSILEEGAQADTSAVDFKIDDEVEKNGGNMPWVDLKWPSDPESMLIPAGEAKVTHEYVADPTESTLLGQFTPGVNPTDGLLLHSVLPHLHKLGEKIRIEVERQDGSIEPLVRIDDWDFDWQGYYEFEEPVLVEPGDLLRMHCEWDNSAENQPVIDGARRTPADVTWGEGTFDEMCSAAIYVTGVSEGSQTCAQAGSVASDSGVFEITFDGSPVRDSNNLEGEMRGPVWGSIYRAEDVTIGGPKDGAEAVASFEFEELDLTEDVAGPFVIDTELPAGDYQFLGFMDTDGNADPDSPSPDVNDPVMIPSRPTTLSCARQPVTISFPLLRPDL